ncbi:MAG: hypothetical protein ACREWG_17985 [Gammaproteobacteria bacterium]
MLSGYHHVYERLNVDGIPYFVNGVGGTWISHFGEIDRHSRFRYADDFGAMMVDTDGRQITFRFVNRMSKIIDQHVLVKDARKASVKAAGGVRLQAGIFAEYAHSIPWVGKLITAAADGSCRSIGLS